MVNEERGPGRVRFSVALHKERELDFKHHVRWGDGWLAVDGCVMMTWDAAVDHLNLAFLERAK